MTDDGAPIPDAAYAAEHWARVAIAPVPAFAIDTHDPVSQDISAAAWDPYIWERIVALSKTLPRGARFVDVGANIGLFSLMAASLGFNVVAFEPMTRNARKLARSVRRNGFEVTLHQNAVSDVHGQRVALRETDGQGATTAAGGVYGVDYVETVTLTTALLFFPSAHLDAAIVKIDVEGLEARVLAGAREWICARRVQHVIVEFSAATRADGGAAEMFAFMRRAGYTVSDVSVEDCIGLDYGAPVAGDFAGVPENLLFSLAGAGPTCDAAL